MLDVAQILQLHRDMVVQWHQQGVSNPYEGFLQLVCQQHEQNYRLWHEEDIARRRDVSDAEIAAVKRRIDQLNQQRNDLIEKLDDWLIGELEARGVRPGPDARQNSETPGSIIDRLSILALRIYHMEEQRSRTDVGPEHLERVAERLAILYEQREDLARALAELWEDILAGRKRLKVYRQFKMYNDPAFNPYLAAASRRQGTDGTSLVQSQAGAERAA
jgi:cell division protein FtsB